MRQGLKLYFCCVFKVPRWNMSGLHTYRYKFMKGNYLITRPSSTIQLARTETTEGLGSIIGGERISLGKGFVILSTMKM